ncbi:MAG: 2,3,4,5-tetrahydropyridine-2,6-dicarboxylate N-succinyltransferase [Acidobacteriota bacterium]|nr:2,3,4,5-tetrahydropyridine-2,6-dicarboxylate N-succinyltransferase [Acidobacteriota bacterium]
MNLDDLQHFYSQGAEAIASDPRRLEAHEALLTALESGSLRAAEPNGDGGWRVNAWVKQAILSGFRNTSMQDLSVPGFSFFDKSGYPARKFTLDDAVRIVPGGSTLRRGAFIAKGVVVMPPAYVNVGAYVDEGTLVDSHALVGSCAQVGKRVHVSAAAQVGGVLEPAGARPVIIEDDVFVGGLVGLFEGIHVRARAVLASGVIITGSTVIYDLINRTEWRKEVPEGAVVVQGSRPASGGFAKANGLQISAPMIVKYRDARTDAATTLEDALR